MPATLLEMLPPLWHVIASNDFIYKPHCHPCEAVSGTNFAHPPTSYYNQMEKLPLSWNTSCIFLPKSSGILILKKKKKKNHTNLFLSEIKAYNSEKEKNRPSWDVDTLQLTLTNVSCYQTSCLNIRRTIQACIYLTKIIIM